MSFFDFVRELRKSEPDVRKAAKAMKILGWICILGGIWNFVMYYLGPFDESPFNLPPSYPYLALMLLISLGALFLFAARGIGEGAPWGKKAGQIAVILLVAVFIGFPYFVFGSEAPLPEDGYFSVIFIIFLTIFAAQLVIPAYLGVRYLGHLPVQEALGSDPRFRPESISQVRDDGVGTRGPMAHHAYKDALLPFGVLGTFALLIAVPMLIFLLVEKYAGPEKLAFMFMPTFLFIFLTPVAYNLVPSPFQRERTLIASYTGGGSIFFFNGTWPFFRLMVYKDGIEVRVMFHRFFIPYDKLEDFPEKLGFFSVGLPIRSNLPGVPSSIRFHAFRMKKIMKLVNEQRKESQANE